MQRILSFVSLFALGLLLSSSYQPLAYGKHRSAHHLPANVYDRVPEQINTDEEVIVIDPHVHTWAAYDADGNLVRAGLASSGSDYCRDLHRRCHTKVGVFRINSLGNSRCKSSLYPRPRGGAPMPYCMFFNGHQALHGSPSSHVKDANVSHGCVRMHVEDAKWLRFDFAHIGMKVIVKPY